MKFIFFAHSLFLTFAFFFVSGEANREHLPSPPPGKNNYHATNLLDVNNNSAQHTGCTFVELQTQLYDVRYKREPHCFDPSHSNIFTFLDRESN